MTYETILYYYSIGLWSKAMVKRAVVKGVIDADQYQAITGEVYSA